MVMLPDPKPCDPTVEADVLATALYLCQSQPTLTGMDARAWVEDAIFMRQRVAAITGVYYQDDEGIIEELVKP